MLSDLTFDDAHVQVYPGGAGVAATPFTVTKNASADGESTRTGFVVYDSLGNEVNIDVTMTLVARGGGTPGTTWRYDISSIDDNDGDPRISSGTLQFDGTGHLALDTPISVSVDRSQFAGATSPLTLIFLSAVSPPETRAGRACLDHVQAQLRRQRDG